MNSLIRRVQNQNDLSKIWAVLDICYQAGRSHENLAFEVGSSAYVQGRMRDLVELLGLEFDATGNIDWYKVINEKELYARA